MYFVKKKSEYLSFKIIFFFLISLFRNLPLKDCQKITTIILALIKPASGAFLGQQYKAVKG